MADSKTCTKCGVEKPLEDFPRNGYSKAGTHLFRPQCKECQRKRCRKYNRENKEKIAVQRRIRYRREREHILRWHKGYYRENRKRRVRQKREYVAQLRARSDEELHAAQEAALPKACSKCGKKKGRDGWYSQSSRVDGLGWLCADCDDARRAARKARKLAAVPDYAHDQPLHLFHEVARWAEENLWPHEPHHVDHIVPLARGGTHEWANLRVLTAHQNCSKNDKLDEELDFTPEEVPLPIVLWLIENPEHSSGMTGDLS